MKLVFRPFGVGVEDIDTKDLAKHGKVAVNKVVEHAVWYSLVAVGLGLVVGKVLADKTADALLDASEVLHYAGNKVITFREEVIVLAIDKNGDDKLKHAEQLCHGLDDEAYHRLDAAIASVGSSRGA